MKAESEYGDHLHLLRRVYISYWAHSMGPGGPLLSRVVIVVVFIVIMDIDAQAACDVRQ